MDGPVTKPSLNNRIWYGLARLVMVVSRWRVPGKLPDDPKYIIIATHTSNWDLLFALVTRWLISQTASPGFTFAGWVRASYSRGLHGWLFRKIGGISIDRTAAHDMVSLSIEEFGRHERMVMIITPEGTRRGVRRWKTGFYHIAKGAHVPILCGFLDYWHRVVGPGILVHPTDDMVADMCRLRDFYYGMPALYPDQVGEPWVPGMENCPVPESGGYKAWLRANAGWMGVSGAD